MGGMIESLRDQVGRALYEEPGGTSNWDKLNEERKEPWRKDADRIIPIVERCRRDELANQRIAQLEGLAIGLEQRGEKSAAHIIRSAIKSLCWCGDIRVMGEKVCAKHESDLVGERYEPPSSSLSSQHGNCNQGK